MADCVKAQEMLLSEQLWSKLTTGEQICVMRVSWGMSPWVDDSSCINFQYWDSAVAKYMAQELDLEPAGYRDLEPTEVFEPSLLHSENPDLQSKMVSEDPCNKSLEDSFQKLKEALEEWKASSSQLVNEFKEYREEIEATEQVTDSCEDCVVPLKENTEHLVVNMQQDSDACNVFDKMPNEKIGASLNLGINSGSHEKLGDSPAMNSQSSNNSGQESGERIPSWYTDCIDELASENPNSEERDWNTLGKPPEETGDSSSIDKRHGIDNWSTTVTYSSNTGMNRISKLSFPIFEYNKSRNWVKDYSVVCGIKENQKLESAVIGDDKRAEVCLQRNLMQDLVIVCGSFDAYQLFDKMPMRSAPLFVGNWVVHQRVFDPGISKGCRGKQTLGPSENFISCDNWFQELLLPQMCSQESVKVGSCTLLVGYQILVFDPGGVFCHDWVHYNSTYAAALVCICWVLGGLIFVWDPGGVVQPCLQVLMLS